MGWQIDCFTRIEGAFKVRDPVRVEVLPEPQSAPDIVQRAIAVDAGRRTQLLRHLIQQNRWSQVLVFVATKHAAEMVADKLRKARINAEPFHGELSQGKRTQVLADFKASHLKVVIATDVAARGLDIAQLPAVDYIHRIGRTGRAGESGVAALSAPGTHFDTANGGIKGKRPSKKDKLRAAAERNL